MLNGWLVVSVSLVYLGVLFAIAYAGDRSRRLDSLRARPILYSLTLGVFCTSWGFFGVVGQAAEFGWASSFPMANPLLMVPTYIGPVLLYLLGWRFLHKLVHLGKRHKITSVADFMAARYGKSPTVAALVAVLAIIGVVPYIALQLKSVALTYPIITGVGEAAATHLWQDTAFYVAVLMALFAILFGTRRLDASEHHKGMMLAIAFESVVKLLAFLAVGAFVTFGMFDGIDDLSARLQARMGPAGAPADNPYLGIFISQAVLGLLTIFCLPRQFHVGVVENTHPEDVRTARWLFPLYLFTIGAFVGPVAAAGLVYFGPGTVIPDTYMLALPMAAEQPLLALIAFIGGLSAGTSMVIVASLALSIMVCNDLIMPVLLRSRRLGLNQRKDLGPLLLWIRRGAIFGLLMLAFAYYRLEGSHGAGLASLGALAQGAVAQFAPALVLGMYWKRGSRRGTVAGLTAGLSIWIYCLLLPTLTPAGLVPASWIEYGPLGIGWLRPEALFGLTGLDRLSHGVLFSLSANLLAYVLFSLRSRRPLLERSQAAAFVSRSEGLEGSALVHAGSFRVEDLTAVAERFLGPAWAGEVLEQYGSRRGRPLHPAERAEPELVELIERLLGGVIGASSARVMLESALRGRDVEVEQVATIVGEASQVLRFNRELLKATFETISQGILVLDSELRLVSWNRRYLEMFDYPKELLQVGRPYTEILRYDVGRGEFGETRQPERLLAAELERLVGERTFSAERTRPNGMVVAVRGSPIAEGGYVTTFSDVTEYKRTEQALRESEQSVRVYTDNVPALITYIDKDRRYRFVNRAYAEMLGMKREDILGRRVDDVLTGDYLRARLPHLEAVLQGQPQRFQIEYPVAGGETRYAVGNYIPDLGGDGSVLGYFALFHDVSDRVRAEQALTDAKQNLEQRVAERTRELAAAKLEAERANLSKTRFLAGASHDLLQPLNAAVLFCSALAHDLRETPSAAVVGQIEGALKSAEELLGELLDISKLDAGAVPVQVEEFEVHGLLQELATEFGVLAAERGLALEYVGCRAIVRSDRQLLRRILQNFLSNAVRYTPRGRILLGCRRSGEALSIQVWDTGRGIPEDQREQIFLEFHRLERSSRQSEKSLGLGLAIADRLARMLGHTISVRSWPGQGSVFALQLSRGVAVTRPPASVAPVAGAAFDGLHVLCIDNEPAILAAMSAMLQRWGCTVSLAADPEAACAALAAAVRPVDLVLADYHLDHGQTGVAAIEALQAQAGYAVEAALVTADHEPRLRELVRERGYALLHKPVRPAALRAVLAGVGRAPAEVD